MAKATTTTSTREVVKTVTVTEEVKTVNLEMTVEEASRLRMFLGTFDLGKVELTNDSTLYAIFDSLWGKVPPVDWDVNKEYTKKVDEYVALRNGFVV